MMYLEVNLRSLESFEFCGPKGLTVSKRKGCIWSGESFISSLIAG